MSTTQKLILSILIIAVIAAGGLWLAGGKKREYSAAIEVAASPQTVFAFLTEPEKHKSWATGLSHVERLESNKDENGDSKRNKTIRVVASGGKESRFEDEVLRFEPDQMLTVRSSNSSEVVTSIFLIEPKGAQTHFSYRVIKHIHGLGRMLAPLSSDQTQVKVDEEIRRLKELVEASN